MASLQSVFIYSKLVYCGTCFHPFLSLLFLLLYCCLTLFPILSFPWLYESPCFSPFSPYLPDTLAQGRMTGIGWAGLKKLPISALDRFGRPQ